MLLLLRQLFFVFVFPQYHENYLTLCYSGEATFEGFHYKCDHFNFVNMLYA